jgi:hypothetical protein
MESGPSWRAGTAWKPRSGRTAPRAVLRTVPARRGAAVTCSLTVRSPSAPERPREARAASCVNEGMTGWRALLGACPLRLPVADIAVASAARGAADAGGVTAYALDDDGLVWSSRAAAPLNPPAAGPFSAIAACGWGRTDPGPVLLAAAADAVQCRYWRAGTREFRWWHLPVDAAGRSVADVACVSLAARRMEAFVLYDDGSVWHSSVRLAQEAVLDWSTWARVPAA